MTVAIHWPQGIYLVLMVVELTAFAVMHGKPRTEFNVWAKLADYALYSLLFWWGGFFN